MKTEEHLGVQLRVGRSDDGKLFAVEFTTDKGRHIKAIFTAPAARALREGIDSILTKDPTFGLSS